jgi:23S rRNA (cytosine1962-C5)-methyltransferase
MIDGEVKNGDIVSVFDFKNELLGAGFYNKNSLIAIRMLTYEMISDLRALISGKILKAKQLRDMLYPGRTAYRMVFSESDFLPGLIIDKYNDTYVLQIYSYGMERNVDIIVDTLKNQLGAKNIFTKNEDYFRRLEGLPEEDKVYLGEAEEEIISEAGINYKIEFAASHKTGFYFDQTDNRVFIEKICKGKTVVDAFCNSGGFGLHAALAGAESVVFADSSANEIEKAKRNYQLNEFKQPAEFVVDDIFDYLEKCGAGNKKFGVVMIDPPAFAKNKKSLPVARKGYERLNRLALEIVEKDGWLVTSSCSFHISEDDFFAVLAKAANKAKRKIQLVHFNNASLDHPMLPQMPETAYLKFAVFKVVE